MFPRAFGPFIRPASSNTRERELVVGIWGLIPWFATSPKLSYSTNNARFEQISEKASYRQPWQRGQRCIIPATSFDEPCWETGRNVWWSFQRTDLVPWGLAGLWNAWLNKASGEIVESYTILTVNADEHPLMSRMHKPDPHLPPDRQDKRSVVSIELDAADQWLLGTNEEAAQLMRPPLIEQVSALPAT